MPDFPRRFGHGVEALAADAEVLEEVLGKFGVVPSPTPITPISGLRTTRTVTCGIFRASVIAARRPALPAPRTRIFLIIGSGAGSFSPRSNRRNSSTYREPS